MIKAIITDLDQTLLRTDKTISSYTIRILKVCQSRGIKVIFATARSTQGAEEYLRPVSPDLFIGYGGALVLSGDKMIARSSISPEIAHQLIQRCLRTPDISVVYGINEETALTSDPEMPHQKGYFYYRYVDFSKPTGVDFLKISLLCDDPAAVEAVAKDFPDLDMLHYSGETMYRFANRKAVKWPAVQAAADYLGLGTEDIAAFGDDVNDLEMLQNCGIGVAVANAIPKVQKAADQICDSNDEDGVAGWIDKHLLIKKDA